MLGASESTPAARSTFVAMTVGKQARRLGFTKGELDKWLQASYAALWVKHSALNCGLDLKNIRKILHKAFGLEQEGKLFAPELRAELQEASKGVNLDRIKKDLMADDPATFSDYGEYELSGSLKDRVTEIIYNHAWEAGSSGQEAQARRSVRTLFTLSRQERFLPAAEKAWRTGVRDGEG